MVVTQASGGEGGEGGGVRSGDGGDEDGDEDTDAAAAAVFRTMDQNALRFWGTVDPLRNPARLTKQNGALRPSNHIRLSVEKMRQKTCRKFEAYTKNPALRICEK